MQRLGAAGRKFGSIPAAPSPATRAAEEPRKSALFEPKSASPQLDAEELEVPAFMRKPLTK